MIPVTIQDSFLNDPDTIRKFALHQTFYPCPNGTYPGERTKMIQTLNKNIYYNFVEKYTNLFFDVKKEHVDIEYFDVFFHKNPINYDEGWIHKDEYPHVAGVLYLTPDIIDGDECGTSIYKIHTPRNMGIQNKMYDYHIGNITYDEYKIYQKQHNSCFTRTLTIPNVYNRLVTYGHDICHKPDKSTTQERLTLVFFAKYNSKLPLTRIETSLI